MQAVSYEMKICSNPFCKMGGKPQSVENFGKNIANQDKLERRCRICLAVMMQSIYNRRREEAYAALGGKCMRCGITDCRVFELDHINGGGSEEERKFKCKGVAGCLKTVKFREWFYSHLDHYQLLCANCHKIKSREHGDLGSKSRKWTSPIECVEVTDVA